MSHRRKWHEKPYDKSAPHIPKRSKRDLIEELDIEDYEKKSIRDLLKEWDEQRDIEKDIEKSIESAIKDEMDN